MTTSGRPRDPRFSVHAEPWMKNSGFEADASERAAAVSSRPDAEIDRVRDSVFSEPANERLNGRQSAFGDWLRTRYAGTSRLNSLLVTLVAALVGGPFAVVGAMLTGRQTTVAVVYAVVFGPVTEELLKQSGMIFLLERAPYKVFSRWQLIIGGALGGLLFGVIENLLYIRFHFMALPPETAATAAALRWTVCTSLHVCCATIASLGMCRAWRHMWEKGKPASLSVAYPYFVAAMIVHGGYNALAILTQRLIIF
jgi:RsiW-degrading membrane proteinase PrsW (M82 family)